MARTWIGFVAASVILFSTLPLSAAQESVQIHSPKEGETLDAFAENTLSYEVQPDPRGDHVHLYVDGQEEAILRERKGSFTLSSLAPGMHDICVKVVNKGHTPIGVDDCVKVRVQ